MKLHHLILFIVGTLIIGALIFWPKAPTDQTPIDELTGTWQGGGVVEDGLEWSMRYVFSNGTYVLTTSSDYTEEGTYQITNRYLDGSVEIHKTWNDGKNEYTFVILISDDPNVMFLEGVQLTRQ